MSCFGNDLIRAMSEALAHVKGEGPAIVHTPADPHEGRKQVIERESVAAQRVLGR